MKIYFAASIRGGRDDIKIYQQLIDLLSKYGIVLTEHIGDEKLTSEGEAKLTDEGIYQRDIAWLRESDVVVAEVTNPSLGVGYEIREGENSKATLCLFRISSGRKLSAMIAGDPNIDVRYYNEVSDLGKVLEEFFKQLAA